MHHHNYNEKFTLPNGKTVYIPTKDSRHFGRQLQKWILYRWTPPRYFYHLRRGGHVAAVRSHLKDHWFLRCDLSRCFDHVTRSKIHRCLKSIGFTHRDAWEFACKSTVSKPSLINSFSLPFGFPQSTILASIVIDRSLFGIELKKILDLEVRLSMYVDDIIISSREPAILKIALQKSMKLPLYRASRSMPQKPPGQLL